MASDVLIDVLEEFLDLTSDKVIREAAYPQVEWIENKGNIGNGLLGGHINNYSVVSLYDEPPVITPKVGGLLDYLYSETPKPVNQDLEKRAVNIANHRQKVQAHQYYKELNNDVNFKSALETFQKKKKLANAPIKLKSEFADFRFYNLTTLHIGVQKLYDEMGYSKTYPDKDLLKQAKGHIQKLQTDFGNGVKLSNYQSQSQLQNYLKQLINEIDQAPRKDNETATAAKRRRLESFAFYSMYAFDEASATVLGYLALMLGWHNYHNKTMETIVKNTKVKVNKNNLKALANALKTPVQKS